MMMIVDGRYDYDNGDDDDYDDDYDANCGWQVWHAEEHGPSPGLWQQMSWQTGVQKAYKVLLHLNI